MEDFDSITRIEHDRLQIFLEDYIMSLKEKISPNTVPTYYFPIQAFLETNDIDLKWRKIRRLFPAKVKKTGKEACLHCIKIVQSNKIISRLLTLNLPLILHIKFFSYA